MLLVWYPFQSLPPLLEVPLFSYPPSPSEPTSKTFHLLPHHTTLRPNADRCGAPALPAVKLLDEAFKNLNRFWRHINEAMSMQERLDTLLYVEQEIRFQSFLKRCSEMRSSDYLTGNEGAIMLFHDVVDVRC